MSITTLNLTDEVRDQLNGKVREVFKTMLELDVQPADPREMHASGETMVAGSVGFIGDVNGIVHLHFTAAFARTLASRMLGLTAPEMEGDEMVNDAIGELSNMVVGSVKSRLCDSGASCVLTIPSIVRGTNFKVEPSAAYHHRVLGFDCGTDHIRVELSIKQSK